MDIIDDIFDTVEKAGRFVASTAVDTKDFVKLEYKTAIVRNTINKKLAMLGKLAYTEAVDGEADEGEKQQLIGQIRSLKEQLHSLNTEMSKYKKVCSVCGKHSAADSAYCSKCGTAL